MSTLVAGSVACGGDISAAALDSAWRNVRDNVGMGLDTDRIGNPMVEELTTENIDTVLLANEALGEVVRRTAQAVSSSGQTISADAVIAQLACDLADGDVDGSGSGVDARVMATLRSAEAHVLMETLAGRLQVDGQDAMDRLDDSIRQIMPEAVDVTVSDETPTPNAVTQAKKAISVLQGVVDAPVLASFSDALDAGNPSAVRQAVNGVLTPAAEAALNATTSEVVYADTAVVTRIAQRMEQQASAPAPFLSFKASANTVTKGARVTLSWATSDAESCRAAGGWSGDRPVEEHFSPRRCSRIRRLN
ncbi:MAG: hypothetical protein R3E84_08995 [Pseudomonadales bacterium]